MNNPWMNWRNLLMGFAKQFALHVKAKGDLASGTTCFVLDDTDIEKTGKTFEFVSRIFNHVTKHYPLGFKMLLLGFCNGKTLITTDCSLHREKGKKNTFGLSKKELKSQFSKKRDSKSPGYKRVQELDIKKGVVAVSMIKRAVKNGFVASYVLMDSWFVNDYMIKSVRSIKKGAMHVLGMCKMDIRKYMFDKKELNVHQLIARNNYENDTLHRKCLDTLARYGKPMLCTEYMARKHGSRFDNIMPLLKQRNVAAINWGLVAGKSNTIYAWDEPIPNGSEPKLWFHDIFRKDGKPYKKEEVVLIRSLTGK